MLQGLRGCGDHHLFQEKELHGDKMREEHKGLSGRSAKGWVVQKAGFFPLKRVFL